MEVVSQPRSRLPQFIRVRDSLNVDSHFSKNRGFFKTNPSITSFQNTEEHPNIVILNFLLSEQCILDPVHCNGKYQYKTHRNKLPVRINLLESKAIF